MGKNAHTRQIFTFNTTIPGVETRYIVENAGDIEIDTSDYKFVGEALLRGSFDEIPLHWRRPSEGGDCVIRGQFQNRLYALVRESVEVNPNAKIIRCNITGKGTLHGGRS